MVQGDTCPGWPIQMGEVQGQVMVADLNADGAVEIFAGVGTDECVHAPACLHTNAPPMGGQVTAACDTQ